MKLGVLAFALTALACSAEPRATTTLGALPPGVGARVGADLVQTATIARIASARGVEKARARELAIRDALFAAAVRADPTRAESVTVAERATLARAWLEDAEQRARAAGPPADAEVNELSVERWTEVDRPPSVRTSHAIVLVKKPEEAAAARAHAERLEQALRGITASDEFLERAKAFSAAPFEVRAERLSPITADGRMWDPAARPGVEFPNIDLDYARAASALAQPGDQSPLVKSAFGYHVILLEERLAEQRSPFEERRVVFAAEIASRRAKKLLEGTVTRLRQETLIEVVRAADSLTALVPVAP